MSMNPVGIIGAGLAGLAAAWELSQLGVRSEVLEKSRGVSGRAATRRRSGIVYDHGANFFRFEDGEVRTLLQERLPSDGLVEIPGPVWICDRHGRISAGDRKSNQIAKWTYRRGISTLGNLLAGAADHSTMIPEWLATGVGRRREDWWVRGANGEERGPYRRLLITVPPPQAAAFFSDDPDQKVLKHALEAASYHPQFSFIFGWETRIRRENPYHALVNVDRQHDIAWLSFEEDKPGHVPAGQSVMVVQMSPAWTKERFDHDREELAAQAWKKVRHLISTKWPEPCWRDAQRWKFAHPTVPVDAAALDPWESSGLFFAGDALAGKGRIVHALKSGLAAARRINASL